MDLTVGTFEEKKDRAKRMMLWFGIISLVMSFAGLTSAVLVSRQREDWLQDYTMPNAFLISCVLIVISSFTFIMAKRALKANNRSLATTMLLLTFGLGIGFILSQLQGFNEFIVQGYNFTGPTSNVTISFIYVIAAVHILHVMAGLLSIMVVIYNHFKQKYTATDMLGVDLSATFWHFVDILWLFLFLFLYYLA
ncbi:heme-copper oxidase subunit III [Subsaximicrobium wynnwilliamsii]|uniref:Heme-copper oxidase subunit III n=1 Tax=Subsaximicrobium wynnwilliamsii TaxID=291179 RepID=A0A5C6ZFS0_9FLAO|nr:cytochrome c oxidase subunit 3 [Subsaximicrobium wynnwilliamsii]TXD82449.1 heme-copper oxidase subunit III [Subsaximicrobium wynnwilliamsii]TXD88091.1 heme-copper oxidase subunit III [Subsaximicrobium wynnwilliamsii]TXE02047.1 heme-copper oxidase subunit III [Subsaximicrobium wynnwilliamsii]